MNTKEITPPDIVRALFPIKGNEDNITKAAILYGIVAFPELGKVLFEGSSKEFNDLKCLLKGGVTA